MKGPLILGMVLALGLCAAPHAEGQALSPTSLSEVQTLKAENLRLRIALYQTQQRDLEAAGQKLQTEAQALEAEFRLALKPPEGATFNWTTLAFQAPAPPKKVEPPQ